MVPNHLSQLLKAESVSAPQFPVIQGIYREFSAIPDTAANPQHRNAANQLLGK
jgi:hypothetical protein